MDVYSQGDHQHLEKNTDDYKMDMKKGNSNILVCSSIQIIIYFCR
jgi:hypothetical protein